MWMSALKTMGIAISSVWICQVNTNASKYSKNVCESDEENIFFDGVWNKKVY